ncbi:MAG TPA: YceI family protein [Rubrivivax sp.]|nr:YceI family protein [Rubrivivax sp.]
MSSRTLFALATLALALAGAGAQLAFAQPRPAQLLAAGSEIAFTTRQMGVPVEGRFGSFSAQVALDPRQPETGRVSLAIDTASARFGSAELDAEVPKPTWLHAAGFPQATFQSSRIQAAGPGRFEVAGKLTIKGATRDLVVPVQLAPAGAHQVASGSFTIQRLDFTVGEAEWADTSLLANDVTVRFKLVLAGLPPP